MTLLAALAGGALLGWIARLNVENDPFDWRF